MWAKPNMLMSLKWPMGCQLIILGLLLWSSYLSDEENGEQRGEGRRQRLCSLGVLGARTGLCFCSMIGVIGAFTPGAGMQGPTPEHPRASSLLWLLHRLGGQERANGAELPHPSTATFHFDSLMFQFWQPERQRQQGPSGRLTPRQLLAGLAGDFKGGKLPWDSFSKVPSQCEQHEQRRRSKWDQPLVTGKRTGRVCSVLSGPWGEPILEGCPKSRIRGRSSSSHLSPSRWNQEPLCLTGSHAAE